MRDLNRFMATGRVADYPMRDRQSGIVQFTLAIFSAPEPLLLEVTARRGAPYLQKGDWVAVEGSLWGAEIGYSESGKAFRHLELTADQVVVLSKASAETPPSPT